MSIVAGLDKAGRRWTQGNCKVAFRSAKAWYDGPAYRQVREHRFRGADYRGVIVEGA